MSDPEGHYGFPDDNAGDDEQSIMTVCSRAKLSSLRSHAGVTKRLLC